MPTWYRGAVNINVKNVDPEVVARLAEQAEAEGLSQQEWIRQTLRRTSARLSMAELSARASVATPMTAAEFESIREQAAKRRRAAVDSLGA